VPIGPYMVDFFLLFLQNWLWSWMGVNTIQKKEKYDFHRDQFLRMHGVRVLRFSNREFLVNQDGVMQSIWESVHKKNPSP